MPSEPKNLATWQAHFNGMMDCVRRRRWDGLEYHIRGIREAVAGLPESDRSQVGSFSEANVEFALAHQEMGGGSLAGRQSAVARLARVRQILRELKVKHPEFTRAGGMDNLVSGIEIQSLDMEAAVAMELGDQAAVALLASQRRDVMSERINQLPKDSPERCSLEAALCFEDGHAAFEAAQGAQKEMNLERAAAQLEKANNLFKQMTEKFQVASALPLHSSIAKYGEGWAKVVSGERSYVQAHLKAITGAVDQSTIESLKEAENQVLDGGTLLLEASQSAPVLPPLAYKAIASQAAKRIANLKHVVGQALEPRELLRQNMGPRAFLFFIIAFLVLAVALRILGFVKTLDVTGLGLILGMTFLISVIGGFGVAVSRLTPFFDSLTKLFEAFGRCLPSGRGQSGKDANTGRGE